MRKAALNPILLNKASCLSFSVALSVLMAAVPLSTKAEPISAKQTVEDTTLRFFELLRSQEDVLQADPNHMIDLVHEHIAPHIAFHDMARWVLARHWRKLSNEDKQIFTRTFRDLLIKTYSKTLINYIDSTITMEGESVHPKRPDFATVSLKVDIPGQQKSTQLRYRMRQKKEQWKVLDITLNGISLLSNYRKTFSDIIVRESITGLITDMESKLAGAPAPIE